MANEPLTEIGPEPEGFEIEQLVAECREALSSGESARCEAILARQPQHAPAIRVRLRALGPPERGAKAAASSPAASPAGSPERVGPFRIVDVLGEGGMGVVYLAQQDEPVRRQVALKIIKLGMDTKQVLARFEAERQALALMTHDNIARVFDAGMTEQGRPYFSMEYVGGVPITDFCDSRELNVRERLDLFLQVCAGVQHAHTKGVIHRDLKPGNVLVAQQDGVPRAKIIDFGLARATDQALVDATLFTEHGQFVGTPEYMSPEQAGSGDLDVDTRTDVHALGVVLYELLTGSLPFDRRELGGVTSDEIWRMVRDDVPPRPSSRIGQRGDAASVAAACRRTSVVAWQRAIRGDLDWIVMKAVEKDRDRRYETVSQLADDVTRHLQDLPVLASAPSAGYRLRKWLQRYRLQAAAAAIVFVALVAGLIGTAWQASLAHQNADDALARLEEADAITDFVEKLFLAASPYGSRYLEDGGPSVGTVSMTLRDVLEVSEPMVARAFEDRPLLRARLLRRLAVLRNSLGDNTSGIDYLQQALELVEATPEVDRDEADQLRVVLADSQFSAARYAEASATLAEADFDRATVTRRAEMLRLQGLIALEEGEMGVFERTLQRCRTLVESEGVFLPSIYRALAAYCWRDQDMEGAAAHLQTASDMVSDKYGDDDFGLVHILSALATTRARAGDLHGAEREYLRLIELAGLRVGPNHPTIARVKNRLARVVSQLGRHDEAVVIAREVLDNAERWTPSMVGWYRNDLATKLHAAGASAEADALLTQAVVELEAQHGPTHPFVLNSKAQQAHCRIGVGDIDGAARLAEEVLVVDSENTHALWARGEAALERGHWQDAVVALDAAAERMTRQDNERVSIDGARARSRNGQGQFEEGARIARGAVELGEKLGIDRHHAMAGARFQLGWATMRTPEGQEQLELSAEIFAESAPRMAVFPLKYLSLVQPERAVEFLQRALDVAVEHRGPADIEALECHVLLARQLRPNDAAAAREHYAQVLDALRPIADPTSRQGQTLSLAAWEYALLVESVDGAKAAVEEFEFAVSLLERHVPSLLPGALGHLAVALRAAGRPEEAAVVYSRATDAMQGPKFEAQLAGLRKAWAKAGEQ